MSSNSRVNDNSKLTERQKLENEIRELSKKAPVFEIKSKEDFEKFLEAGCSRIGSSSGVAMLTGK